MARFRFPIFDDHDGPIVFAHRGGAAIAPENTLAAFAAAHDHGVRLLETDVRLTADGVVVVFHDGDLARVADAHAGPVEDMTLAEVREVTVGGEPVPTLDEALAAFPDARWSIDAKTDEVVRPLLGVLDRHDAWQRVCLGAFSDRRLSLVRRLTGHRVATVAGPREIARLRVGAARTLRAGCAAVPARAGGVTIVDAGFVRRAHALAMPVVVWTIDDPDEMHRLFDLGVDGVYTDRPDVAVDVLRDRGEWRDA
jgi:glycerophosphoryl diester phosphodiesterase